jgi:pyridinium-3,5-bisthiocarboxylic acid mononucleotide nickel chelatase
MTKIAYLDCFSGISGDMFLGALLDAGLSFQALSEAIGSLPVAGYVLDIKKETRHHIVGTRFIVTVHGEKQPHRSFKDIRSIISESGLSDAVKGKSIAIFKILAEAEAHLHGVPADEIHFHEVGAVDSIIDVVGAVYGIEALGIEAVYVSAMPLGSGFVKTAHGKMPLPAPATVAILRNIPIYDAEVRHETVTPTGAALVKGLADSFGPLPPMAIDRIGYGAGRADLQDRPNLLRVMIGPLQSPTEAETVVLLEANVDDVSPQWLGYVMERLFEVGALDVAFLPVQMKKNRPGVQIQVIGRIGQTDGLMDTLFHEGISLGIRFQHIRRIVLQRSEAEVDSPWGKMRVKRVVDRKGAARFAPEYEACREIALKSGRPLRDIFRWVETLNP